MAGLAPISLQQFLDLNGRPQAGARAAFLEANTLSPIITYYDYGLGSAQPNPVVADAYGRFPPIFIDEDVGFYRLRVTNAQGVIVSDLTTLPVIGPTASGGGSEVPVDPNSLFQTGDPLWLPRSGTRSGWVRMNGRTIGSATSGAAERANADCESLFQYLWSNYSDTYCPVTGGRGISSAADWAANKPIQMLDMRGRGSFGLDDMGNAAANSLTGVPFLLGNATTAAAKGGEARHQLSQSELPAHTHEATVSTNGAHTHTVQAAVGQGGQDGGSSRASIQTNTTSSNGDHTHTVTNSSVGNDAAHNTMPLFMLGTWYQRL